MKTLFKISTWTEILRHENVAKPPDIHSFTHSFIHSFIHSIYLLAVAVMAQSCTAEERPPKLNVLLILVDDLEVNDLGFTGSTFYETPHLDRLASRSMAFTQGYAGSRVCSPSRATLLT